MTSPRPAALVDREGLSLVRSPAMVLRCADGSGVLPEVLAATINALPDQARSWRTWRIPRMDRGSAQELEAALQDVSAQRHRVREQLRILDELSTLLIDGVASEALTVVRTTDAHTEKETS